MDTTKEKIQKLVDKASENFGNDTILAFITDEFLALVEKEKITWANKIIDKHTDEELHTTDYDRIAEDLIELASTKK